MFENLINTVNILGELIITMLDNALSLGLVTAIGLLVYCVVKTISG